MTPTEKAIRDFCGHHADWWPSTTQVQEMLALAQTEQEPVAWGFRHDDGEIYDCISPEAHADCEGEYTVPLYTVPPAAQPPLPVQEPVLRDEQGRPMTYWGGKATPPAAQPAQEPPSEWALIKNILDAYGFEAISFVADWKEALAQPVQGLDEAAIRADEREACAVLAQQTICDTHIPTGINIYGTRAAKAIRARGNT